MNRLKLHRKVIYDIAYITNISNDDCMFLFKKFRPVEFTGNAVFAVFIGVIIALGIIIVKTLA